LDGNTFVDVDVLQETDGGQFLSIDNEQA